MQIQVENRVFRIGPDHSNGYLCKHIIFVLHRVLKVDRHSPLLHQKALLTVELHEIFVKAEAQQRGNFNDLSILAEREVGYMIVNSAIAQT